MSLTPAQLARLWDHTARTHSIDFGLAILAAAYPDGDADERARLPLGERDRQLIAVRCETLGDELAALGTCPSCDCDVEISVPCAELVGDDRAAPTGATWQLEAAGYRLTLRSLNSIDAAAAAHNRDAGAARMTLLERAVVHAIHRGRTVSPSMLPAEVVAAVSSSLADHDPLVEIQLRLGCPTCGAAWEETLDVATFVQVELAHHGSRILADVDLLARSYGWSEAEILGLDEARRATYVAMVEG
jgi:hypothetical protein